MSFFGFSSKKEVERKEREARRAGYGAGEEAGREAAKDAYMRQRQTQLSDIAQGSQIAFSIPYFDVFDPRFSDFGVPVAVHGEMIYDIEDFNTFRSVNKIQSPRDGGFIERLRGQLTKYIKGVVANAPSANNIAVVQLERKIVEIGELIQEQVTPKIEKLFAIHVKSIDITNLIVDKDSRGYRELKSVTTDLEAETLKAHASLNIDAMRRRQEMQLGGQEEMQRIQLEHQEETMRIQREELQRASRLQTESNFLDAHRANLRAQVGIAQAQGSMAPPMFPGAGMPQMPGMQPQVPNVQYFAGINGQQAGPFNWQQLQQLVQQGHLTEQTYVWKQGMPQWVFAGQVEELAPLFDGTAPLIPGM